MPISDVFRPRIAAKLRRLYGNRAEAVLLRIDELAERYAALRERTDKQLYGEQTVLLITYGDQLRCKAAPRSRCSTGFCTSTGSTRS